MHLVTDAYDRPPRVTAVDQHIAIVGHGFNATYTLEAAGRLIAALKAATAEAEPASKTS